MGAASRTGSAGSPARERDDQGRPALVGLGGLCHRPRWCDLGHHLLGWLGQRCLRPAPCAMAVTASPAGRDQGQDDAQDDGRRRDQQGHVDLPLRVPGEVHLEGPVVDRAGHRCRIDAPPVGECVDEDGVAEVGAAGHPGPPSGVEALAEDEVERCRTRCGVDPGHGEAERGRRGPIDGHRRRRSHRRRLHLGGGDQRHGPTTGGRVEHQLVDVEPGRLAERRAEDVAASGEGEPVGVGTAERESERLAVEGGRAGPGHAHPEGSPVDGEEVTSAGDGDGGGNRRGRDTGDPDLGDADGQGDGCLGVVVQGVLGGHLVDSDADVAPSELREADRHVDHRAVHRAVGHRREIDGGAAVVGGDGQLGRDRVLAVGHDLEVEMIEGDRLPQVVLEPLPDLLGEAESRLPDRAGVAADGGHGTGTQVVGEAPPRVGDGPGVVGAGAPDQAVDLVVGDQRGDPRLSGQGEGPRASGARRCGPGRVRDPVAAGSPRTAAGS